AGRPGRGGAGDGSQPAGEPALSLAGDALALAVHFSRVWLETPSASPARIASAAATAQRGFSFDPASTLGWSLPLILLAPLLAFMVLVSSVRSRRGASDLALLATLTSLAATLLVGWARFRHDDVYKTSSQWINLPIAFTGPPQFQGFGIDITLRVDHLTLYALLVLELVVFGVLAWQRAAARAEPGPLRFNALVLLLLLGGAGVLLSGDLAELAGFWGLAGVATYLLLAHRWGADPPARAARLGLWLPLAADLSLLCGAGLLYSRYGQLDPLRLVGVLHSTPGAGLKSLTAACILIFAAAAGRAAIWPFSVWQTGTAPAPAAGALAQGVWPLLAGSLFYRALPLFAQAGPQALRSAVIWAGVAALAAGVLALAGNDARRVLTLAGAGVVAACLLPEALPGLGATAFACLVAVGPARAAGTLALGSLVAGMRAGELEWMGEGLRRMRGSATALLLAVLVLSVAAVPALVSLQPRRLSSLAAAEGLFLAALAGARVAAGAGLGPLLRRRAFEPERVREAPGPAVSISLWLGLVGALAAGLGFFTGWLAFLEGKPHRAGPLGTDVLWLALVAAALLVVAVGLGLGWPLALRATRAGGYARFLVRARLLWLWRRAGAGGVGALVDRVEADAIARGEGRLGQSVLGTARRLAPVLPLLPLLAGLAGILALAAGLLEPGVFR
ncbi:MAG TPA: proton-conducting transporter membrane subunit, partial [Candidatus Acidoferrales bacterium]|nr:proton-conducting transporter membrane subunit [Candidatus Acidoferrales bacterium]